MRLVGPHNQCQYLRQHVNPWIINPSWQNFSSMFREAVTAHEAKTGMERSHHLTACLYFGISALEAFLNRKMRERMKGAATEDEIFNTLKSKRFGTKLRNWPTELLSKPIDIPSDVLQPIIEFNDIRGDLTHPKTSGHDVYEELEFIKPLSVVGCVAEYIVRFHQAEDTRYPYWIFGWNYLNPRPNSYEIFLLGDQQFSSSLQGLGFDVPAAAHGQAEAWRNRYLGTLEGYLLVKDALESLNHCEPKANIFPFMPILCRRWWTSEHHQTCGHVTAEALEYARSR